MTTELPPRATLPGRCVVLGVAGGIAAYKAVEVCRQLVDSGAHVAPVLTDAAQRFVGARHLLRVGVRAGPHRPLRRPRADPAHHAGPPRRPGRGRPRHRDAARQVRHRHRRRPAHRHAARDPRSGARSPPPCTPRCGSTPRCGPTSTPSPSAACTSSAPPRAALAGGDEGPGRLADPDDIVDAAGRVLAAGRDLPGVRVLVTAGGTREPIDPVRFVGNRSSGKMGHAIADAAARRGARVTLVTTTTRPADPSVERVVVETAEEMADAVLRRFDDTDVVVMAAAVADFRPKVARRRQAQEARRRPRARPRADPRHPRRARAPATATRSWSASRPRPATCATTRRRSWPPSTSTSSSPTTCREPDAGFEVDTNRAVLLDSDGAVEELPLLPKTVLAGLVLDRVRDRLTERRPQERDQ